MQHLIIVSGRVQGVNFRYFTQQNAIRLGIRGYVKNLPDGGVEIVADGEKAAINQFVAILWKGPPAASVDAVNVAESPIGAEFTTFSIEF